MSRYYYTSTPRLHRPRHLHWMTMMTTTTNLRCRSYCHRLCNIQQQQLQQHYIIILQLMLLQTGDNTSLSLFSSSFAQNHISIDSIPHITFDWWIDFLQCMVCWLPLQAEYYNFCIFNIHILHLHSHLMRFTQNTIQYMSSSIWATVSVSNWGDSMYASKLPIQLFADVSKG